jgi:hypothetical protein
MGRGGGSRGASGGGGGGGGGGGAAAPTAPVAATTTPGGVATTPLTKEERSAVYEYSGAYYREINGTLRGENPWTDLTPAQLKSETAHIDAAIRKGTLTAETTLYRGTSMRFLGDVTPGTVLSDKAFFSASRSQDVASSFGHDAMIRVTAPRGTKAADVSHHAARSQRQAPGHGREHVRRADRRGRQRDQVGLNEEH